MLMKSDVILKCVFGLLSGGGPDPRVLALTLEIIGVYERTQPGWWWDAGKLVMRQEVREGFIYTGFFLC